jgi:hypothetical protein
MSFRFSLFFRSIAFRCVPMRGHCCKRECSSPSLPPASWSFVAEEQTVGRGRDERPSAAVPSVPAMPHIEPHPLALQPGRPSVHTAADTNFSLSLPVLPRSSQIGAFEVNIGSGHVFTWTEFGRDFYVHCYCWKVKEKEW